MTDLIAYELFPRIFNMSVTAGIVIVCVLLTRLLLRKAPKVFSYALWAVVLFRLLCPVSVMAGFSLLGLMDTPVKETTAHIGAVEYVQPEPARVEAPQTPLPAGTAPEAGNETHPQGEAQAEAAPAVPVAVIAAWIWLAGVLGMALYSVVTYLGLRRRLIGAVPLRENIYLADHIGSPFVMGLLRPKIYLPSSLTTQEQAYIIRHEQRHIRRLDHVAKALAFAALCVHWFNPLVWAAFILSGKDMEMSCDEAVVRDLGEGIRADYSASLLRLATGRRIIAGTPLAFGEGDTKGRIRNLVGWRKPKRWLALSAAVLCIVVVAACVANPQGNTDSGTGQYASMEDFAQQTMAGVKTVSYDTAEGGKATANVLETKQSWLEKQGEVADLAPEGVLEAWTFQYLVRLDADPADVRLVGGMSEEDGWFDMGGQGGHNIVALRYADGSYDILYNEIVNDALDFYGYHDSYEEAVYDWYVKEKGLDLPLYVEDWTEKLGTSELMGNFPVHRYDGDGWYLYIPVQAWDRSPNYGDSWQSGYGTGSALTVYPMDNSAQEQADYLVSVGWERMEDTSTHVRHWSDDIEDFYYDAPEGGSYLVRIEWQAANITDYPFIAIEPDVLRAMAGSFVVDGALATPPAEDAADTSALERVVNGIFVGSLSYDETWVSPGNYNLTATQSDGRTDAYTCAPQTYYSIDSTPGRRLVNDFDWSTKGASGLPGVQENQYTFRFANDRFAITVYSGENKIELEENGVSTILVASPNDPNMEDGGRDGLSAVFLSFLSPAVDAAYDHALGTDCLVSGTETDYDAIAQTLSEQYARSILARPGWFQQSAQDAQTGDAKVFDAYYGADDPNFCFVMNLYLKLSPEQSNRWQAGSGLDDPLTDGPYTGYYLWAREAVAAKGADGNWHITGINTGGSGVALPHNLEAASAEQLAEMYFLTTGQSHDYLILYYMAELPLEDVTGALAALAPVEREELRQGILKFMENYPDYCSWSPSDFA